jgi:predicted GNAT family N-acyltransferase
VDSFESLEYAVSMAEPNQSDTESQVRVWIKKHKKENSRLEFKLKVDLSTPGAKAEFIRDVIALANSEGENPRSEAHLVIGFKSGKFHDIKNEHYDGAIFGQILDSYISPPVNVAYEEYGDKGRPRVGVLIVKPNARTLYLVNKRLLDEKGQVLLFPGQSWGRKSDRKIELTGEAIHTRLGNIIDGRNEEAAQPLKDRIKKLEHQSGPAFEVRRIRFEIEGTRDWDVAENCLQKLIPYAREFDHVVKHEVLDAVMDVTGRTRQGMPEDVARSVDTVLLEVMPVKAGGFNYPSRALLSESDQELLKRIEHAAFEMTWDACRYLRDVKVAEVGARLYWYLIRFTTLNRLRELQAECLHNARYCQHICMEDRKGATFTEGHQKLDFEIADALDAFECKGYEITSPLPKKMSESDFGACVAMLKKGDAVDWKLAQDELPRATALAVAWKDKQIVGVGAIKRERREYAAGIASARKSGFEFLPETLELGYVAVSSEHRGHHISDCLVRALIKQYKRQLFATTYSLPMKDTLTRAGFQHVGKEWKGKKEMLSLWIKT